MKSPAVLPHVFQAVATGTMSFKETKKRKANGFGAHTSPLSVKHKLKASTEIFDLLHLDYDTRFLTTMSIGLSLSFPKQSFLFIYEIVAPFCYLRSLILRICLLTVNPFSLCLFTIRYHPFRPS